ncbi:hypothetical protein ACP4OV_028593 [Aristida adscensionis]
MKVTHRPDSVRSIDRDGRPNHPPSAIIIIGSPASPHKNPRHPRRFLEIISSPCSLHLQGSNLHSTAAPQRLEPTLACSICCCAGDMDTMAISSLVWFSVALVIITAVVTKVATRGTTTVDPLRNRPPPPPLVTGTSVIGLLYTLLTRGFPAMIQDQYSKLGSVFTVGFFGKKITFLIGPEVLGHFYQGPESEISHGNFFEFTVPILGKEVGYGVDSATRNEHVHFCIEALKPSKLRSYVRPMLQEVEVTIME